MLVPARLASTVARTCSPFCVANELANVTARADGSLTPPSLSFST
jgi:hypothetical protein